MKPSKRIYCRECGRSKLLFESEKKALTFIKFNADEIESENTTSMKNKPHNLKRTDKVIEAYKVLNKC